MPTRLMIQRPCVMILAFILVCCLSFHGELGAATPVNMTKSQPFKDHRRSPLKDLNGYFPFQIPENLQSWEKRSEELRSYLLVMMGLWPLPTRTPLNPVIHGLIDQGDYTIEKVFFESFPGFFVTGNLYRPKGHVGPRPGILSPHGHWENGRFMDNERIWEDLNQGAERFENGGRSHLQSRHVQLARMGCVVFHYDMVGYGDCHQISYALAHKFEKQRPGMNTPNNWGFFSPLAEAHVQNIMGLQTWNSMRSLDFLLTLPEVDADQVAITGASGGGTQAFMMGALDKRVHVCFPAVMVSTSMQGGCTCENASGLRIHAGNVEIAALFAPKPLGMTGANDWTVEMITKGFPELQGLYDMYGLKENTAVMQLNHFGHNYNYVSRSAMYHFMNEHLGLHLPTPIVEGDYERLNKDALSVWSNGYPAPSGGKDFERDLLQFWHRDAQKKLRASHQSLHAFRHHYGTGIAAIIGRTFDTAGKTTMDLNQKTKGQDYLEMTGNIRNTTYHEAVSACFLHPDEWNGRTLIWPTGSGKSALFGTDGKPIAPVKKALNAGCSIVGVDLLFQDRALKDHSGTAKNRKVRNPREFAGYTYGYNHPLFAQRVHDLLSLIAYVHGHEERPSQTIELVGLMGAGHWVAAARAMCHEIIQKSVIETEGFRFADIQDYLHTDFLHGAAKYGDIGGMIAMGTPSPILVMEADNEVRTALEDIYASAGFPHRLHFTQSKADAIKWLIESP
jgi:hypothetical protein